jgi:hypothetical protein
MTGDVPDEARQTAFQRAVCMFVVACLQDRFLSEAWDSLSEIYGWQLHQQTPRVEHKPTRAKVGKVNVREGTPFTLDNV